MQQEKKIRERQKNIKITITCYEVDISPNEFILGDPKQYYFVNYSIEKEFDPLYEIFESLYGNYFIKKDKAPKEGVYWFNKITKEKYNVNKNQPEEINQRLNELIRFKRPKKNNTFGKYYDDNEKIIDSWIELKF